MREVIFDLETTGFRFDEGHRIVEIGGVEMVRGALTGQSFHSYVNPKRDMPEGAFKVHGLSEAFLKDKPVFEDPTVARAFVDFIGDANLVAHNGAGFDLPFLNAELVAADMAPLENKLIDTLHMARKKFPGSPASLDALCSRFGIALDQREKDGHGALLDSELLATVYIELTGGLQAGLNLEADTGDGNSSEGGRIGKQPVRTRLNKLGSLITKEERQAHLAFINEMGENALWIKTKNSIH